MNQPMAFFTRKFTFHKCDYDEDVEERFNDGILNKSYNFHFFTSTRVGHKFSHSVFISDNEIMQNIILEILCFTRKYFNSFLGEG